MLALMPIAQVTAVTGHRGSTSGYAFILPGGVITWSSKKQTCVFLSTAEAEYVSLCTETQVVMLIRRLLTDLGCTDEQPTVSMKTIGQPLSYPKTLNYTDVPSK